MSVIQERVHAWHTGVYGPNRRPLVVAKKLLEEASECHIAAKHESDFVHTHWTEIIKEAADCAIVAFALAGMAGIDLEVEMNKKLDELEQRGKEEQLRRDDERGIDRTLQTA